MGSTQGPFKDITIIEVASHMKYVNIKQFCSTTYGNSKTNWV